MAAARHVFARPFKLSSLNFREALKGHGHQNLHADWGSDRDGRGHVLNSIWLLDDMNKENGATRLVPGSHKRPHTDMQAFWDSKARTAPDEIQVEEPAGSVIIYNALMWHGGGHNHSGARRRTLHGYFTARERTAQRLSPAARWLLKAEDPFETP
jgi:ectoine hydroxylase-related dioxygenase (phytanoyl-CoA dioxygenase family)